MPARIPAVLVLIAAAAATLPAVAYAAGPSVVFRNTFAPGKFDSATAVAVDAAGNVYAAGSESQPGGLAPRVAFVAKWSADGSQQIYSVTFGGSGSTTATGVAVDASGNAYVTGYTSSGDFPVSPNAFQQKLAAPQSAFVAKFNAAGSKMVYATLLGGSQTAQATGIAVDANGNAVITGQTQGSDFPLTANAFQSSPVAGCTTQHGYINVGTTGDAFVSRISGDGSSLEYSTLLGGSCATSGVAIALDASGNAWVTGTTESPDFPVTSGALQPAIGSGLEIDGFFAEFSASGQLRYASYLGGSGLGSVSGIAFDAAGDIYLAGISGGSNPAAFGATPPNTGSKCVVLSVGPPVLTMTGAPFAVELTPDASTVKAAAYLNGTCVAPQVAVTVDASGTVWIGGAIGGYVPPPGFTTVSPIDIGGPGFLNAWNPGLSQILVTSYFDTVNGLTAGPNGGVYVAGQTPWTYVNSGGISEALAQASVTEVVESPAAVSIDAVLPAGTAGPAFEFDGQPGIAPGEVLRLTGRGLGPVAVTAGTVSQGFVASSVAGVSVTIGGVAAPLLSVSSTEIDCMAPFEIGSQSSVAIQVQYNAAPSNVVTAQVLPAFVQVLGVFNDPYFTPNAPASPVQIGSGMTLTAYIAGVGQTNPPMQDGQVNQPPYAQAGTPVQIFYPSPDGSSSSAQIIYAGAAPGLAAGIWQVNFTTPNSSTDAEAVVKAGGSSVNFPVYTFFVTPNP